MRVFKVNFLVKWFSKVAVLSVFASLPAIAQEAEPGANGTRPRQDPQVFADWRLACDAEQPCRISQAIVQPSTNRLILQVKAFAAEEPVLLLTFPSGILLSTGWQYQIDAGRPSVLPFEICNSEGCHVGVKLDATLLNAMKRGSKMKVTFFDAAREKVTPEISLIGFTKAWEALR